MNQSRQESVIAETGKQFVLAGVLWIIGAVVFSLAAYKLYENEPLPPPCPPEPDCPPHHGHMW